MEGHHQGFQKGVYFRQSWGGYWRETGRIDLDCFCQPRGLWIILASLSQIFPWFHHIF